MKQLSTLDRNKIKELIHEKNQAYNSYRQNKKTTHSLFISSNCFIQS